MSNNEVFNTALFLTPFADMILYGVGVNGWLALGLSPVVFILIAVAIIKVTE